MAHGRGEVNDLGGARSSQLERATGERSLVGAGVGVGQQEDQTL